MAGSAAMRRRPSEREQLDLFRAIPGELAARDAQDLMAYPFFSLAKSHRAAPRLAHLSSAKTSSSSPTHAHTQYMTPGDNTQTCHPLPRPGHTTRGGLHGCGECNPVLRSLPAPTAVGWGCDGGVADGDRGACRRPTA